MLVGDPDQLSSVEAGAVLADISGPAQTSVVRLTHNWRFDGEIADLADAVRTGDADRAVALLGRGHDGVALAPLDPAGGLGTGAAGRRRALAPARGQRRGGPRGRRSTGDPAAALEAIESHRLLCAHRRGPYGVTRWNVEVEQWLARTSPATPPTASSTSGRPLLVTANDRDLDLWNGDTGVVTNTDAGLRAAFARADRPLLFPPVRLDAVQTVHAMTVHKAQGSQFDAVTLVLPPPESPLLTRELLYTAITRARQRVLLLGTRGGRPRARSPARRAGPAVCALGWPGRPVPRVRLAADPALRRRPPRRGRWPPCRHGHRRVGSRPNRVVRRVAVFGPVPALRRRAVVNSPAMITDAGNRRATRRSVPSATSRSAGARSSSVPGSPMVPASSCAVSSSRVNQPAQAISSASTQTAVDDARAKKPVISERGNDQGWLPK